MITSDTAPWQQANQRYLMAALDGVRAALARHAARDDQAGSAEVARQALAAAAAAMPAPAALELLAERFGLSAFEQALLLLCAGVELDAGFAALCAAAQGNPQHTYPSFGLALAALPEPHWDALTPTATLRHWRLIDVGPGDALATSRLRIDERVLHELAGVSYLDERLTRLLDPLPADDLAPTHRALARRVSALWAQAGAAPTLPVMQLCGEERASLRAVATATCALLGLAAYLLPAQAVPTDADELDALARLWGREAILTQSALVLDCAELDGGDPARQHALDWLSEHVWGAVLVLGPRPRRAGRRPSVSFEVLPPPSGEQRALWRRCLGPAAARLNGQVEQLVAQFNLGAPAIRAACAAARLEPDETSTAELQGMLWDACRAQARPQLDDLARRIVPAASWDDLVLPEAQRDTLREIAAHMRQRARVYQEWGFAAQGGRGLGISALFAGASGTGKTMAAEVLAGELRLDLYHVDLSQIVSKYIGETEKNLRRVFDAAEAGGAILLFDEADALFGKRSEVKDSHDRHANIEVSYLLQRMESYRGLAILTTNMKSALDAAFLRRLRFVVQFPFPDAAQRAEIWRRVFPAATPTVGLEIDRLARLNVAGGTIRNVALSAAFLAANAGEPVGMGHLLSAARGEYARLEKPLTAGEIAGWCDTRRDEVTK